MERIAFKKTAWKDVRDRVAIVNPELFQVLDQLDPSQKLPLYEMTIPYGQEFVQNGQLLLPDKNNQLKPLDNSGVSQKVVADLAYNNGSSPVTLILERSLEIFITMNSYTLPFAQASAGSLFGTWKVLAPEYNHQPAFLWNISAGVRSLFMLPKISVTTKFNQLKSKLELNSDLPKTLLDHGRIFQEIINSEQSESSWSTKLLFFGKQWFEKKSDPAWVQFFNYLYAKSWIGTGYWRSEFIWNLIFSFVQRDNNLKPDPYIADTAKHLLSMGVGAYPGFAPAINDDVAPISYIQEIFMDIYGLKKYPPIIMQPCYYSPGQNRSVYYSLQYPTTFCFSPKSRRLANKIIELIDIKYILSKYLDTINSGALNLSDTPLNAIPTTVQYDYFHSDIRYHSDVRKSSEIFAEDKNFRKSCGKYWGKGAEAPINSSFLNGCVRLSDVSKK